MNIDYTGRHCQIDDHVKELTARKLAKVTRFLDEPIEVRAIVEVEKHRHRAEINVSHRHGTLQATEEADATLDALHAAVEKLDKQARRVRKKHTDKLRRAARDGEHRWDVDIVEAASLQEGAAPRVIRSMQLPIKPMTIDEAALQLQGSKNDFFVFRDSTTERVSVLYKRRDQNYGLIAPEF